MTWTNNALTRSLMKSPLWQQDKQLTFAYTALRYMHTCNVTIATSVNIHSVRTSRVYSLDICHADTSHAVWKSDLRNNLLCEQRLHYSSIIFRLICSFVTKIGNYQHVICNRGLAKHFNRMFLCVCRRVNVACIELDSPGISFTIILSSNNVFKKLSTSDTRERGKKKKTRVCHYHKAETCPKASHK